MKPILARFFFFTWKSILQTPNFPSSFSLPLRCSWILENDDFADFNLHFYFTQVIREVLLRRNGSISFFQFYLSPGFLTTSTHDSREEAFDWIEDKHE